MKFNKVVFAGIAAAVVAGSVLAPSTAFAANSTVAFDKATICPGEMGSIIINGVSNGTQSTFTAPEYARSSIGGVSAIGWTTSMWNGPFPYAVFAADAGKDLTIEIATMTGPTDPNPVIVSTATIQILSVCAPTPDPEPTVEALPNTGQSESAMALGAGLALAAVAGGAVIARRARRNRA